MRTMCGGEDFSYTKDCKDSHAFSNGLAGLLENDLVPLDVDMYHFEILSPGSSTFDKISNAFNLSIPSTPMWFGSRDGNRTGWRQGVVRAVIILTSLI